MEIREIREDSEDLSILEAINEEAIPEIERCALSDMLATGAKVWCIDHEQEPVGFMAVRYYRNLFYLAYFAVRKDLRSKGIGGRAVRELIRQNPDKQVVVEYEAPDPPDVCNDIKHLIYPFPSKTNVSYIFSFTGFEMFLFPHSTILAIDKLIPNFLTNSCCVKFTPSPVRVIPEPRIGMQISF